MPTSTALLISSLGPTRVDSSSRPNHGTGRGCPSILPSGNELLFKISNNKKLINGYWTQSTLRLLGPKSASAATGVVYMAPRGHMLNEFSGNKIARRQLPTIEERAVKHTKDYGICWKTRRSCFGERLSPLHIQSYSCFMLEYSGCRVRGEYVESRLRYLGEGFAG
ncbi:hypothetical protein MPTK2_8g06770 [Marchantia polymorpha subsp. ruderalis]